MSDGKSVELVEVEAVIETMNAMAVPNPIRQALVRDLGPVAIRMRKYADFAETVRVNCKADDDAVTEMDKLIAADIKSVEGHDVLSKIIRGLDQLHGRSVAIRGMFVNPMKAYRKAIREPALAWQAEEKKKADEIARKAQAEADAKAARGREALLKKAEAVKTPEKQEAYREQAAAVIAPTVTVEAPKSGLRVSKAWKVKEVNAGIFFAAIAARPDLWSFAEINTTRLERGKAANPSMTVPGVEFEQITR